LEHASKPKEEKSEEIKVKKIEPSAEDKSNEKKDQPTKPVEPEAKEKKIENIQKSKSEENKKEKSDEKPEKKIITKEKKIETKQKEQKKVKSHDDDFKYIVRIANTDIDGEKTIVRGLTSIKGIGMHMSELIVETTGIDRNIKIGNITDKQMELIIKTLNDIPNITPRWMMNHRKNNETGEDIHLIGPDIEMRLRDEVNIMKKIRCYRGIRHETGLRVRGQRTRTNNRYGLTLGVSKKKVK